MMTITCRKVYVPDGIRDDNCMEMQPLGYASFMAARSSMLQLHEVCVVLGRDAARRHCLRRRKLADGHGNLVAGVAPDTVYAVLLYLVGQGLMCDDVEVEVIEEGRYAS